ncbi:MAG: carboxypeptidase-like regulatory domain-containing protein [Kofleriaceae bacterium]
MTVRLCTRHTVGALAVVFAAGLAAPAMAQPMMGAPPAEALGRPLPLASIPSGTVSVRVIEGEFTRPQVGAEVTLTVDGAPRTARTDGTGRAVFAGLTAGATVQATITGEDGQPVTSQQFAVPAEGVAVMLTTRPLAAAAPSPTGGMPEPRRASGQPQAFPDPAGQLTITLTHDDLSDPSPPAGVEVILVGYDVDDGVAVTRQPTDAAGVARFTGLDVSGGTAYYAWARVPRGQGVDRLASLPITLGDAGVRVILSSLRRDDASPALDDAARLDEALPGAPIDAVTVSLDTDARDGGARIELVDAATGQVVASRDVGPAGDPGRRLEGTFSPLMVEPALAAGTLEVGVFAGEADDRGPLPNVAVFLEPDGADAAGVVAMQRVTTGPDGVARFTAVAPGVWRLRAAAGGDDGALSPPLTVEAGVGAKVQVDLRLASGIPTRVVSFTADELGAPGRVFYAQTRLGARLVRSVPLAPTPGLQTTATLEHFPVVMFQFQLDGGVDDKYLGIQGDFAVYNRLPRPYLDGPDGLLIPLPRGFTGAQVADDDAGIAAPDRGGAGGLRIRRPLPPRGVSVRAGFSLVVEGGAVAWDWDLPWGAVQSRLSLVKNAGMTLELPAGVEAQERVTRTGIAFLRIADIMIEPGRRMSLTVRGLPAQPAWKVWAPRIVGLAALLLVLGGVGWALAGRKRAAAFVGDAGARRARIEALMEQLVDVERRGDDPARREALVRELEALWPAGGRSAAPRS